jgi:hypothetical protein
MADFTVTAATVQQTSTAKTRAGIAGETLVAGQVVFRDSADSNKIKLADCTNADKYQAVGITINGAADGQPIDYVEADLGFDPGFTAAIGDVVILSTAGNMALRHHEFDDNHEPRVHRLQSQQRNQGLIFISLGS